jgi:HEAT repeat protein
VRYKIFAPVLVVASAAMQCGLAQSNAPQVNFGHPMTTEQKLKQHHIELTRDSLINALHNSDAEVRYLAAQQLTGQRDQDAVPVIVDAATQEKAPRARINMAFSLALIGEKRGFAILNDACNNSSFPGYLRAAAAAYLLDVNDESCLGAVVNVAEVDAEPNYRMAALALLPRFKNVSKDDSQRIYGIIVSSVTDSTPALRLTASSALVQLGTQTAIPVLQSAITSERDQVVRAQMESDLHSLEKKQENR